MSGRTGWGYFPWGLGPWGSSLSGLEPPIIYDISPGVLEVEGGTVVTILGANFIPGFVPEVLTGPPGGPYTLVAEGYLFDPDYDLTPSRGLPGMPARPTGTYSLRVRTPIGVSNVLENVLFYKPHADEVIIQKARSSLSEKWRTGTRLGA